MASPIPVIIGPTAVGKTDLSLAIAHEFSAAIVGADSRQVYRYLDIGTAKPDAAQRQAIPHHLIDVVDPDEPLNAARFAQMAWGCIRSIEARRKQPLVVGGSGMYIRALTDGLFMGPGAHPQVRATLEVEAQDLGVHALHHRLVQVDPEAASRIHPNDRVRIIRALEIYTVTGTPISRWQRQWQHPASPEAFVLIGLRREREDLRRRIAARTEAMLRQGLVDEVRGILARGFPPTLPALQCVGYGEIIAYLAEAFDLHRACEMIERHTWRLAKRQMTWFRHIAGIHWISLTETPEAAAVETIRSIVARAWEARKLSPVQRETDAQAARCTCPTPT
jgi:tRNA dimethylallyltransferase